MSAKVLGWSTAQFMCPVQFGSSVWVSARGSSSKGTVSLVRTGMVPSRFGDESFSYWEKLSQFDRVAL